MNALQETLAKNMRDARERLGYSQMRLAELCDLSPGYVAELETGKKFPSSESLIRISKTLGMKPYQLLMDDKDGSEFDRYAVVSSLYQILKKRLNEDLEEVIKEYLSD